MKVQKQIPSTNCIAVHAHALHLADWFGSLGFKNCYHATKQHQLGWGLCTGTGNSFIYYLISKQLFLPLFGPVGILSSQEKCLVCGGMGQAVCHSRFQGTVLLIRHWNRPVNMRCILMKQWSSAFHSRAITYCSYFTKPPNPVQTCIPINARVNEQGEKNGKREAIKTDYIAWVYFL